MTTDSGFHQLISAAAGRPELLRLAARLGFAGPEQPIPPSAWAAWGLRAADGVGAALVAGRAGSLDALLVELRTDAEPERLLRLAAGVRARNPARLHLFLFAARGYRSIALGTFGAGDSFRHVVIGRHNVRATDIEALEEMAARPGEAGLELAVRQARALDRGRVTRRFFREFRAHRSAVSAGWTGLPQDAARERDQLALLFLCRLTFLYFIQRSGALAGDEHYLPRLLGAWVAGPRPGSPGADGADGPIPATFYRARLEPLFFAALNRRTADRDATVLALGALPYLNGGLFERSGLERRHPSLDLPDLVTRSVIEGLLERYRFTTREAGEGAGLGVDPEMLGRVFEGLMAPGRRGDTGSFYTPAPVVSRVVREAVRQYLAGACGPAAAAAERDPGALAPAVRSQARRALERVRVLDPACGSGAFLLGALWRLSEALGAVTGRPAGAVRREVVGRSLHGVDLLEDAALLCSLRLWLALSAGGGEIRPLPNLDRRIRQGDALVDPLDLGVLPDGLPGDGFHPLRDPQTRRALRAVEPASRAYLESEPADRELWRARLADAESTLARRWADGLRRAEERRVRDLRAIATQRDLFGQPTDEAQRAVRALPAAEARVSASARLAEQVDEKGALPFFSFGVHFAEAAAGFDIIISNPPWVRAHRWPEHLRRVGGRAYEVCRRAGWRAGARLTGTPPGAGAQVDLALLFLEQALRLLAPGGVLAMLLPAKTFRALYGSGARAILLRDLEIASIEDHSLHHRSIFRADAFTGVVVGRRRGIRPGEPLTGSSATDTDALPRGGAEGGGREPLVRIRMVRRGVRPLRFQVRQRDLPIFADDPESPWVLAPPAVLEALRAMQRAGPPLGAVDGLRVRRGVMTGANDALVLGSAQPGLGGISRVEAEGYRSCRRRGRSAGAAARYRAYVETAAIRPLVRGAGIDAFSYRTDSYVVWCHDAAARPVPPPARMAAYLARHRQALEGRSGWRPGLPLGAVFRLGPETLGHKVAWHDLSDTLRAVALPPTVCFDGAERELVPLNTVYFLPVPDRDGAVLLAGLLNSLPVRVFARALAERAKDARFRFFAWTLSCLPLPDGWRGHSAARDLLAVSADAHAAGGVRTPAAERLDRAAAALYALDDEALAGMAAFDRWLRGEP